MFDKILIANRGEIACRVIKTARRMGIATVAVHSDADSEALHVQMADEAVRIGPPPAAESYLSIEAIIEAAKTTGAQAVHPGYGFLSERAAFCQALEAAGVVFIGPGASAIEAMGDKITSKKIAAKAGVSTVPGHMGLIADADEAALIADRIGYPVMIKASAGGGGKGMRIAWTEAEARDGFARSKSEAGSSFGDDRIFIEKFVEEPRHIEIQVLADAHGNCIHLGERECSIQRRNQKVIEEAPSPFLDEETRAAMGAQAVALARAVDYRSAGTVEFIVDKDRNFYFLEMNTRLQVEHPVTELVTGLDLAEQMIRIAAGEKLALAQDDVGLEGWAIESRVYAEDPMRGFLPSIGRLTRYQPPAERCEDALVVRNDTGVFAGAEIPMFYDPMIAKLCTWAPTRPAAIEAMSEALDGFVIDGIAHNMPFLASLMAHPRWRDGCLTTAFIAEEYPDGFAPPAPDAQAQRIVAAIAVTIEIIRKDRLDRHAGRIAPHSGRIRSRWVAKLDTAWLDVAIADPVLGERTSMHVTVGDMPPFAVSTDFRLGDPLWRGEVGGRAVTAQIRPRANGCRIDWRGHGLDVHVLPPHVADLASLMPEKAVADTSRALVCPMPGLVVSLHVEAGQKVQAGDTLAVIEAMKMENVLRAERDATVTAIHARAGDSLAVDAVIMEFE
ncbi:MULTISPECIES: acetyl/propionyl/methylcrotonyl-CoA carboxylase subunit alpha [unclassified Roseitalea]|uniref:acetyl-CoA carboxylase biotin carboxylase subunit n=1 Tax=unclassified Roseitalea TaxID=2639107 RepID=UPI00273D69F1|nr:MULTISPECIES: acetyl/propionyl/methylcrotonyl-CoA carboxylase subunit alpha [unclassified Roseitalea]